MKLILNFTEVRKEDIAIAGGKGANLGELIHANMPVPPGFIITTKAYDSFVSQNHLEKIISANLQNKNNDGVAIRSAFIESKIPEEVKKEVLRAYSELGTGAVAVRSSATAEDLPEASFAGQQETYLNVVEERELLDATRRAWASLWTARAISYRARQGIDQEKVKLAVVVQRMVDADFAGVMFTSNPINGNRKEIVIDANPGLGEAVVSGRVTPDHFILSRGWFLWHFIEKTKGRRELIIKSKKGGGIEHIEQSSTKKGSIANLPEKVLTKLASMGVEIEKHFKSPQDIEWVWSEGVISIVQSRPITALPDELPKQNKITRMLSGIISEMMQTRPLPLESTLFGLELVMNDFIKPFLKLVGVRISPLSEFLIEDDGVLVQYNGKMRPRPTFSVLLAPFRLLARAIRYNPSHWEKDWRITGAIKKIKELEDEDHKKLSSRKVANIVKEALGLFPQVFEVRILYFPRVVLSMMVLRVVLLVARRKDFLAKLLFSDIKTKVTETNDALENIASKIRADKILADIFTTHEANYISEKLEATEEGREFLREFQDFLDEYGYRESGGTMLTSEPTWKESPQIVFGILKILVSTSVRATPKDTWEDTRNVLTSQSILRFQPLRFLFLKSLETARNFHEIRENTRFYLMMTVPTLRRGVLELGGRLTEVGILDKREDVFYLRLNELVEAANTMPLEKNKADELIALVSKRKLKYESLKNIPVVDPRLYRTKKSNSNALLAGVPGSPGVREGVARVIHDSSEFHRLQAGNILIAPYTNPAWTPLFEIAGGVIVDTGGAMSHAAIVAREYGIPAVMGVVDGTIKIKDGDKIRIDGTNGTVFKK